MLKPFFRSWRCSPRRSRGSAPSKAPEQGYVPEPGIRTRRLLKYRVAIKFGEEPEDTMPAGWKFGRVSSVTTDSKGEVYVFQRGKKADPVVVYDAQGSSCAPGPRLLRHPHGIRADKDDNIWCVDNGNHQVYKFTRDGKLLLTLESRAKPAPTTNLRQAHRHRLDRQRRLLRFDGYGNSRVVKFNKDGKFLLTWGKPGSGPGEFHVAHSVAVDSKGLVYVSDRENNRIQIFDANGKFLKRGPTLAVRRACTLRRKMSCGSSPIAIMSKTERTTRWLAGS